MGTCGFIYIDTATPEPTDLCLPKWVCYAVGGTLATITIVCMTNNEQIEARLKELGEIARKLREMLQQAKARKNELQGSGKVDEMAQVQDYIDTLEVRIEVIQKVIDDLLRQLGK